LDQPASVNREQRQNSAELDQDGEGFTGGVDEAEEPFGEKEMGGRRHRKEFGNAFNDAEDEGIDNGIELHRPPRSAARLTKSGRQTAAGRANRIASCERGRRVLYHPPA